MADALDLWRFIRASRHRPPGDAGSGRRRTVYAAAMRQAEEFFTLADNASFETKPVLLYYGLNQAVRALLACSTPPGEEFEVFGHGIKCVNINSQLDLGDLVLTEAGRAGAFVKLLDMTASPGLPKGTTVRELWSSLPEGAQARLSGSELIWSAAEILDPADKNHILAGRAKEGALWLHSTLDLLYSKNVLQGLTPSERLQKKFPVLNTLNLKYLDVDNGLRLRMGSIYPYVDIRQDVTDQGGIGQTVFAFSVPGYTNYNNRSGWIIPTIGGNIIPISPLATWWAILYVLSMLARYRPSEWRKILDIDSSPDAPAVEYVLSEAHISCARLVTDFLQFERFRSMRKDAASKGSASQ